MNDYGTPDALTMLPYWTNGCIGSMEGLYYEASATTPFHFIDQSELSLQPSDPMVGLPYASAPDVSPRRPAPADARRQVLHGPQPRAPAAGRRRPVAQAHRHARALRDQLRRQHQRPHRRPAAPVLEALPGARLASGAPAGEPARRHAGPQQLEPAEVPERDDELVRRPEALGRLPGRNRPRSWSVVPYGTHQRPRDRPSPRPR